MSEFTQFVSKYLKEEKLKGKKRAEVNSAFSRASKNASIDYRGYGLYKGTSERKSKKEKKPKKPRQ